jgi:TetR/AcrR family transcriptional regulator
MPTAVTKKSRDILPARDRLLRAAMTCFARAGYDGTTVDEIVAAAQVNKRMVYHYFGDKERLYHAVLAEAYRSLELVEIDALSHRTDFDALTAEIVRTYFNFLRDHPEFVRLLLWENLNDGAGLAQADFRLSKDPMLTALSRLLRDGIAAGRIRADMDARYLLISLIGLCLIYSSNRYTLSQSLRLDLGSAAVREAGILHVTKLLLEGIKARG